MIDDTPSLDTSLTGLPKQDWLKAIASISNVDGSFQTLGRRHFAAFIEKGSTLLVTFETIQGMHVLSEMAQPFGWEMLQGQGWSHLCVASDGDTWFRDEAVFEHFDTLVDDGFFDEFETVVFYGAGPCAYAAAAFSVAAPGARVVLIQPQATLDPRVTEWDDRFEDMRRVDFSQRYGYAPEMLEAADSAFVLYDPYERLDAMHAALFTRSNVTKLRMAFMGNALQTDLMEMNRLDSLLAYAAKGALDTARFAKIYRARRNYQPYLRNLLNTVETRGREKFTLALCRNVTARVHDPRFARKLRLLENAG